MHDSIYMKQPQHTNPSGRKTGWWFPGAGDEGVTAEEGRASSVDNENVLGLDGVDGHRPLRMHVMTLNGRS